MDDATKPLKTEAVVYTTTPVVAQPIQPAAPPTGCSVVCMFITAVFAFGFSSAGLIWPKFYTTSAVLLGFTFVLAILGVCWGTYDSTLVRPLAAVATSLAVLFPVCAIMTYADYKQKCDDYKDLGDRPLQNAYEFDCGWGVLLIVLWSFGIVISVIMWIVLAVLACCTVSSYDNFRSLNERRGFSVSTTGRSLTVPKITGNILSVVLVVILFIVMMVASFAGHKTGAVDGICPAGEDFFEKPHHNDLGCCHWAAKDGTCCHQSACLHKSDWTWSYIFSNTTESEHCDDLFGLLSCSVCHTNSGLFSTSVSNITVCMDFCNQLYESCCYEHCDNAYHYCTSQLGLLVSTTLKAPYCFNSAPAATSWIGIVIPLLAALLWGMHA